MSSAVSKEEVIQMQNTMRKKLHNQYTPLKQLDSLLKEVANAIEDDTGLSTKWMTDRQSFFKNETTFYAGRYEICTYRVKYDSQRNAFLITEVESN
ncbi:hypothetical protein [Listeria booriae]|uniref:hypothetical protein n=1 Tax=Listeria booriae TaxID=1552123 RepID=UPI00162913A3|nr:hypothetical protein [Listeria booriae]MBC2148118.1 hypothetical protein [Listeria booriae]